MTHPEEAPQQRGRWERAGPLPVQTALVSFSILALELALIRWSAGQIRAFAYFNSLVLIGAFLGTGLGTALGGAVRSSFTPRSARLFSSASLLASPIRWVWFICRFPTWR